MLLVKGVGFIYGLNDVMAVKYAAHATEHFSVNSHEKLCFHKSPKVQSWHRV